MKNKQTNVVIIAIAMMTVIGFAMSDCASTEPAPTQAPVPVQLHYDLVDGNLTIHEGVTSIKEDEFYNKGITSVTIPDSVTLISINAFSNNQLNNITIGNGVKTIAEGAFSGNQLTSVTIGNSVTRIGERVFANNPLTSVTIPDSVASFDKNIFSGARNLTQISIGANVNFTGTERLPFNFEIYYVGNNRQAGIYSFSNNNWNFRPR